MRSRLLLVVLLAIAASLPSAAEEGRAPVALWRLRALGIDESVAARVSDLLGQEIDRLPGFRLVPAAELSGAVTAAPELARCSAEPICLQAVGRAVSARWVVAGVLAELGESYSLGARLLEVESGREVRRLSQAWNGERDELIEVMRQTATRLLAPERFLGRLRVETNLPGVEVLVDGLSAGRTPLAGPIQVSPGTHALKLVREGFRDVERFVEVAFDRELRLSARLESTSLEAVTPSLGASERWWLGLKAGAQWDLESFWAPAAELEVGLKLPFWTGRLAVALQTGAWGGERRGDSGPERVRAGLLAWPVELGLVLRPLPEHPFTPFLAFSAGLYLVWQELALEGFPDRQLRELGFGFVGGLGVEYRLGPGLLLLELRYRYLELPALEAGGLAGLQGGLGLGLGYRWML